MKKYWFIITISICALIGCSSQKKLSSDSNLQSNSDSDTNLITNAKREDAHNQKDWSFENTKWILKTIDGEEIETLPKPAYITFSENDKMSGYSGCNGFSGSYYLSGDILKLDNIITTQRGCLNKNPEKQFYAVLSRTDACVVVGNKLIFTQMGKEIATFEGVSEDITE
ncbi:MAG: META domain-containing protein [Prevotellaceae bacterium]|jgi:heat shock protein HslJ|nr:META domain-containing protein [Prevotellaceae bacterium]